MLTTQNEAPGHKMNKKPKQTSNHETISMDGFPKPVSNTGNCMKPKPVWVKLNCQSNMA